MAWRLNVQGLFLHGGRHHFNIGTNNTDCSFHAYTDCTFSNASGAAIRLRPPADFPYYHGSGSTQVTVRDSKFFNNEQVTIFFGDTMTIEDVWVEGSGHNQSAFKALFENHAKLILNRMLGVPYTKKGLGQRWIDNWGYLTARNCRFGGEGGGMTIVHNKASFICYPCNPYEGVEVCPAMKPDNGTCWAVPPNVGPFPATSSANGGVTIRIEDSDIFTNAMWNSSNDVNAAFYFEQIPEVFILKGSVGFQECPWQADGCEPAGYTLVKVRQWPRYLTRRTLVSPAHSNCRSQRTTALTNTDSQPT
jgi:hypothetical protein